MCGPILIGTLALASSQLSAFFHICFWLVGCKVCCLAQLSQLNLREHLQRAIQAPSGDQPLVKKDARSPGQVRPQTDHQPGRASQAEPARCTMRKCFRTLDGGRKRSISSAFPPHSLALSARLWRSLLPSGVAAWDVDGWSTYGTNI